MPRTAVPRFPKKLIAMAVGAAVAPYSAWALDLSQAPPGSVEPYVRPNVIISIDDSGSMNYRLDQENESGAINDKAPTNGVWPSKSRRINVLKYALIGNNGVGGVMRDTNLLPDKKIRLSWQAMNANNNTPGNLNSGASAQVSTNSMKILDEAHRDNFISFVGRLTPSSSTPSHKMLKQAHEYMTLPLHQNGPWASEPGRTGAPYLGCRRNYHIFMTDGRWNGAVSGGSQDSRNQNFTLPDGTAYGSTNATSRPYNYLYHDTYSDTLADWAFKSWATELQSTGLTGTVQPTADYRKAPATENFGKDSLNRDAILERYWNPRYNPATWPHMVTYTIGFSNMAFTWPGASNIVGPSEMVPFGYNGSFPDFVTGNKTWPKLDNENKRALDLWHAALNGRGRFYAVEKGEDLEKAFREIFGQINVQTDPDMTSSATSGSNTSRNDVGKFTAAYEPQNNWKGFIKSETVRKDGTTISTPSWGSQNTADKLDAMNINNRLILTWSDKQNASTGKEAGGTSFEWASDESLLSNAQKNWLETNAAQPPTVENNTKGQQRLNYIRGDRTLEGSDTTGYSTAKPYRERKSRQGDIVNSTVWYTGAPSANYALKGYAEFTRSYKNRQPMIYVGGNDGMLHGFAADDKTSGGTAGGTERIAYVPKGVIPKLRLLTAPEYNESHRFYVDGSPMTGDVDTGTGIQDPQDPGYNPSYQSNWRTLLVGTLGAGGRGYFVLDVTNPGTNDNADGAPGFRKANAQSLVKLDRTRDSDEAPPNCASLTGAAKAACEKDNEEAADIGHITAQPVLDPNNPMRATQITRMNNNRWAVVLGNGFNSANQRPVLLIQYLDGDIALKRISTTTENPGTGVAKDNGLSAPRLLDLNGDGRVDVAYAGDNLGNLWKFDLMNLDDAQWGVAFDGAPLFTARGPASLGSSTREKIQPITVAPIARANDRRRKIGTGTSAKKPPVGGMMVAFGTGRNVAKTDAESVDVQTLYSVLDNTRYEEISTVKGKRLRVHAGAGNCATDPDCVPNATPLGIGVINAKLAKQKFTEVGGAGAARVDVVDDLNVDTWSNKNGWYLDLPAVGERLLKPMEFYDGSNLLTVYSQVPAKGSDVDPNVESCESTSVDEERQYRTFVNIMDGKKPTVQLVDYNGDGIFSPPDFSPNNPPPTCTEDCGITRMPVTKGPHTIIKTKPDNGPCVMMDVNVKNEKELMACMPEETMRPSWRQMK